MADDLIDTKFTRYFVPNGGGLEEHPSGLAYRRTEVDPIVDALRDECRRLQDAVERAAQIVEDGYTCRRCGCIFIGSEGHPDNGCIHPSWDTATDERKAEAIRAALQQDKEGE